MCLRDLVESAPYFSSLDDLCYLRDSKTGLVAPYARLSGYCLKENPDCCRYLPQDAKKIALSSSTDFVLVF